ncbi:MAG TPA: hypothetical protein VKO16_11855 [Polyangia bacterium]|nr:hypothetical protein [Polyangia bacterium]
MRWCVALSLVLVALIVTTVRITFRKPQHVAHAPVDDREAELDDQPAHAESPAGPLRPYQTESAPRPTWHPAPVGHRARAPVVHLHGRVLPPSGGDADDVFDGLEVIADDGTRTVTARLSSGGRFSFHLPPGRYTLYAEAGDFSGMTTDVPTGGEDDRDIAIQLGPAATIGGTLTGPDDAEITVLASAVGATHATGQLSVEPGKFSIEGLIPGRRYDLVFSGPKIRTATLRSIAAPASALEVALAARPVVRGTIGFPNGDSCPIETVSLRGVVVDADDDTETDVDADCHFELTPPEGMSELTVVAEGPGFYLEESVEIPPQGDPDPICLNPPCPPII